MTKQELKKKIVQFVNENVGCKAILVCCEEEIVLACDKLEEHLPDIIEELITERELVEVEYFVPDAAYRIKSILFPKETEIRVSKLDTTFREDEILKKG